MRELTREEVIAIKNKALLHAGLIIAITAGIANFFEMYSFVIGFSLGALTSLLDWLFLYVRVSSCYTLPYEKALQKMHEGWWWRLLFVALSVIGAYFMKIDMVAFIFGLALLHIMIMVDVIVILIVQSNNSARAKKF